MKNAPFPVFVVVVVLRDVFALGTFVEFGGESIHHAMLTAVSQITGGAVVVSARSFVRHLIHLLSVRLFGLTCVEDDGDVVLSGVIEYAVVVGTVYKERAGLQVAADLSNPLGKTLAVTQLLLVAVCANADNGILGHAAQGGIGREGEYGPRVGDDGEPLLLHPVGERVVPKDAMPLHGGRHIEVGADVRHDDGRMALKEGKVLFRAADKSPELGVVLVEADGRIGVVRFAVTCLGEGDELPRNIICRFQPNEVISRREFGVLAKERLKGVVARLALAVLDCHPNTPCSLCSALLLLMRYEPECRLNLLLY